MSGEGASRATLLLLLLQTLQKIVLCGKCRKDRAAELPASEGVVGWGGGGGVLVPSLQRLAQAQKAGAAFVGFVVVKVRAKFR